MADGKIFIISGRETAKEKILSIFCNVTEERMGSDKIYTTAIHLLSILGCCDPSTQCDYRTIVLV